MASSVELDLLIGDVPGSIWAHEASQWWISLGVLAAMTLIFATVAVLVTGRHDPGKKR